MKVKFLLSECALILILLMQIGFSGAATAQISVIQKTSATTPPPTHLNLNSSAGWNSAPEVCTFSAGSPSPWQPATPPEDQAQPQGLKAGTCSPRAAARAEISAFLESQKVAGEETAKAGAEEQQRASAAAMERLFQLSETVEWRIESGEADDSNVVGVFASRTLYQGAANTSLKFDAGVNVEAKSGSTAGLAGFVVAW